MHKAMNSTLLRMLLVPTLCVSVLAAGGCSAFQPKMVPVTITPSDPNAMITVDGVERGTGTVVVELARNKNHAILARSGSRVGTYNLGREISGTGVLDIVGTFLILFPGIGLFTPGFWDLETDNVVVPLG